MSYFDHVRCHSCRAVLAPESLAGGAGLQCPKCGVALNLQDLFGLGDAFVEAEEGPVSLDDLVSGPRTRPATATARPPASAPPPAPAPAGSALAAIRALKKKR